MKYFKDFKNLCTPASVYLFINVIIFISIAVQNFGNNNKYCVGQYTCNVPSTFSMFLFKAIYILFWTFILNAICKAGYKEVSWFMVLLPIILLFIIIGLVILNNGSSPFYEGFKEGIDEEEQSAKRNKAATLAAASLNTAAPSKVSVIDPDQVSEIGTNNLFGEGIELNNSDQSEHQREKNETTEEFTNLSDKKTHGIMGFEGFKNKYAKPI